MNTVKVRWLKHFWEFVNHLRNCFFTSQEGLCFMELVSCLSDKSRNRILNQLWTSPLNSEGACLETPRRQNSVISALADSRVKV